MPVWTVVAACLLPPAAAVVAFLVAARIRGVLEWPKLPGPSLLIAATIEIFLVGGPLGEEPGWRGFLLPWLRRRVGALRATLVVWIVWLAWHVPLFWVPGAGQQEIPPLEFAVALLPYAVMATWLYESSHHSILIAALLHTSINVTFLLAAMGILDKDQGRLFWPIYLGALTVIATAVAVCSRVFRRQLV